MNSSCRPSARESHSDDDGSGRIALIGLIIVAGLIIAAAVRFIA